MPTPSLVAVVGPTASGKSDLGVALAERLDGEVVNADAMQLYRGMDIGTAKLSLRERRGIPHHLLDVWDVTMTASVAVFQRLAREAIDDVRSRGRLPVLVGGSWLYVVSVVDDYDFPGTDPALRSALEADLAEHGPQHLHDRLTVVDPVAAQAIQSTNGRRLVRALEVVGLRGSFTATLPSARATDVAMLGLDVPRDVLDRRIDVRVATMLDRGLVDETRALIEAGLRDGPTSSKALGYAQVLRHLDDPSYGLDDVAADTAAATRRFARRQDRFWRRDPRVVSLPHNAVDLVGRAVAAVAG